MMAMAVGGALLLFMALYYKLSGLLADFEVILNIVLTAAGLQPGRLTCRASPERFFQWHGPDNNILIQASARNCAREDAGGAVDAGFDRATLTILSQRDHLIAAAVLYQFDGSVRLRRDLSPGWWRASSPPWSSRLVFDYILSTQKVKTISIDKEPVHVDRNHQVQHQPRL
jgi:preprotein translocase subunit SecD